MNTCKSPTRKACISKTSMLETAPLLTLKTSDSKDISSLVYFLGMEHLEIGNNAQGHMAFPTLINVFFSVPRLAGGTRHAISLFSFSDKVPACKSFSYR